MHGVILGVGVGVADARLAPEGLVGVGQSLHVSGALLVDPGGEVALGLVDLAGPGGPVIHVHTDLYIILILLDGGQSLDLLQAGIPGLAGGHAAIHGNGAAIRHSAAGGSQGPEALNHYYIKTIHHEFTHILNQIKDYPTDFKQVTGSGYVADNWSKPPYNTEYLKNGFISDYAQHSDGEDFAEMLSIYVTNTQEYWDSQLKEAGSSADFIRAKLQIVRDYMKSVWSIDIDELRSVIIRRQDDVMQGKVDLSDLTVK